ncbi:hypothetical protein [Archangium sp.]|uniref:hypothetical protein n=1 Tax=Archangium sp. TaxID=1872627 RepID=UPI00389A7492
MKHLSSSRSLLLALGLLLAPAAQAMEPEQAPAAPPAPLDIAALHPCAVEGEKNKELLQKYQAACASEFGNVPLVPADQVLAFLEKQPRKSCALAAKAKEAKEAREAAQSECLGRLATATQASRALLITITRTPTTFVVHGLVVDSHGQLVKQLTTQKTNNGDLPETLVRAALSNLHKQLKPALPENPPATRPPPSPTLTEAPPPSPQPSEPTPDTAPPESIANAKLPPATVEAGPLEPIAVQTSSRAPSWRRPAAYASAGVGVVALGLAGFFALSSNSDVARSNTFYKDNAYPAFNQLDEIAQLRESASTKRTLAGVSAGVGAALIGAGAFLWLQDRPASHAPGVAAFSVGPHGVSVLGFLP